MSQNSLSYYATIDSPVGEIILTASGNRLTGIYFGTGTNADHHKRGEYAPAFFVEAIKQLEEYFIGVRKEFELPLATEGTEFQKRIWAVLTTIPYGRTKSYGEVAALAGEPKASRAVGMANNKNPIAIIVPCHRVIGANGSLIGYAGGIKIKQWLLNHEQGIITLAV